MPRNIKVVVLIVILFGSSRAIVQDGGLYACTAQNRAGQVTHSARLNIYGKHAVLSADVH